MRSLVLLILSSLASAQATKPIPITADANVAAIQQLEADWLKAELTTDPAALEHILSDDFVNLAPNGLAPGKAQLIKNWQPRAGQAPAYTVEESDMHMYVFGDTAVTAYVKLYTAKENGKQIHEDTTHVFLKEKGVWKLRLSRSSFQ